MPTRPVRLSRLHHQTVITPGTATAPVSSVRRTGTPIPASPAPSNRHHSRYCNGSGFKCPPDRYAYPGIACTIKHTVVTLNTPFSGRGAAPVEVFPEQYDFSSGSVGGGGLSVKEKEKTFTGLCALGECHSLQHHCEVEMSKKFPRTTGSEELKKLG